jgi:hypothetical protein
MEKMELPEMLRKYFWDCSFEDLRLAQYPIFISERVLNLGDMDSLRWLFSKIDKKFLIDLVNKSRNLNKKTKNYWKLMLCQ